MTIETMGCARLMHSIVADKPKRRFTNCWNFALLMVGVVMLATAAHRDAGIGAEEEVAVAQSTIRPEAHMSEWL